MKIDEALKMAEEWTQGHTFYEGSQGWRPAIAVLAAEVRRQVSEYPDDPTKFCNWTPWNDW